MIIRLRGADGMYRVEVSPDDTFSTLGYKLLTRLPDTVDADTITLSNSPNGGDIKRLREVARARISQVGLRHGDLIFISC